MTVLSSSRTVLLAVVAFGIAAPLICGEGGGDSIDGAVALLRGRIAKAVAEGKPVDAHVLVVGERTKVRIVKCDEAAVVVRGGGLDVSLKWSDFDATAIANAARGIVAKDGEGMLALIAILKSLGKDAAAAEVLTELAGCGDEQLNVRARKRLERPAPIRASTAPQEAQNGTVRTASEPTHAVVPLWSEEAAKWIAGGRQFFVGPKGSPDGAGSRASPWDLRSVLDGKRGIKGGDVVWVMAGTYKGCFTASVSGSAGKPVVIRAAPGERVVLDCSDRTGAGAEAHGLEIPKAWVVCWGLEAMNSDGSTTVGRPSGYWFTGPNSKMINCNIHDGACCGYWKGAVDSEIYGCLLYNLGGQEKGHGQGYGHNMYTQNETGTKLIRDNIIFNGFRNGIDGYTTKGPLEGFHVEGNTLFGAAACANEGGRKMDLLIGGLTPASRILIKENLGWSNGMGRCVQFGYGSNDNKDVTLTDNYVAGCVDFTKRWEKIVMKGNKFFGKVQGNVDTSQHPENYYGAPPKETAVFVRPNQYEPGRANITIYNWSLADFVPVDVKAALPVGAEFEIRNAQNWNQGPVAAGTYDGKPVSLPMNGMDPVQPIGAEGYIAREEMTGKAFNVFVLTSWTPGSRPKVGRGNLP